MSAYTILVVEDDTAIRRGLIDALSYAGYQTLEAADGEAGRTLAIESTVHLVLLDVTMPKMNGFEVLDAIRSVRPRLPVIMLTARGAERDRVRGLQTGADDYVVKPFSAREVLARIEAVLRRSAERPTDVVSLKAEHCKVDFETGEISSFQGKEKFRLSERELEIIRYLAVNQGRIIAKDELLQCVWGLNPKGMETRAVDMQIRRLRQKLEEVSADIIETVRGKGYALHSQVEVQRR